MGPTFLSLLLFPQCHVLANGSNQIFYQPARTPILNKYSHYEIKILSDYLNINVILLGKNNTNKLPNGIRCFNNNSNKYLLFNIVNNEYDKYSIILKNKNKFILQLDDFPKRFITNIINKYCKKIIINDDDDEDDDNDDN